MAQRNYLINTTTISTTASGTTISSGNTQDAAFVVARTLVRGSIPAGTFSSGSQTWSIHYVVSAMVTPYNMRLKVQRRNSGGTVQAESGYGATRSSTGTYDDNLTADLGTWAANDQLALVWEHFRPSGTGNKSATIDANGSSYIDAPTPVSDVPEDLTGESINNLADRLVIGLGLPFGDSINNLADGYAQGYGLVISENANNLADYFTYGRRPRWLDSLSQQVNDVEGPDKTLSPNDDLNAWGDSYAQGYGLAIPESINNLADGLSIGIGLIFTDDANSLSDYFTYGRRPRWQDAESHVIPMDALSQTPDDSIDYLADTIQLGIGLLITDNVGNLADDHSELLPIALDIMGESINSLVDAPPTLLESHLIDRSDSLNFFADNRELLSDGFLSTPSDSLTLADAAPIVTGGIQKEFTGESINNLDDYFEYGAFSGLGFFDSLSLDDYFEKFGQGFAEFFDSITTLADAAPVTVIGELFDFRNDSLALDDRIDLASTGAIGNLFDSFSLADRIDLQGAAFHEVQDNLSQDDDFQVELQTAGRLEPEDQLSFDDDCLVALGFVLEASDDLNNWLDLMNHNVPHPSIIVRVKRDDRTVIVEP